MKVGNLLGRVNYYRGKGQSWVEMVRAWVTPAAAAGGVSKYFGLQSRWAILVAILIPVIVELAGVLMGRFLYRSGGVRAEYQAAADADPFKLESLRLAGETAKETRQTRIAVIALYHLLVKRPPTAP